ncbi:HK97-gp10 family putative phage morphogenesis protein [Streptomyces sp. NPDC058052]|uniref:HK97-gp10 family putative phage morphogenesis protein n=1 Tax=Streptomyces sp. NPDC058052 TaxID=3346316 RepID=UPI0036E02DDE
MPPRRRRGGRNPVTVRITGIERLRERLASLDAEVVKGLKEGVTASAEAVRDETARTVRRDSGNLSETVDVRYEEDGLIARVGWFEDPEFYAHFAENGTRSFPAQPSLRPALEAERGRYRARLTEAVRRALR